MKIELASAKDLPEILKLQKMAFQSEARMLNNYNISPLSQTLEELEYEFNTCIVLVVKEESSDTIVGSIRAYEDRDRVYVGKLVVHPQYQNRGLGTRLLKAVEAYFTNKIFQLHTTSLSLKNLYLYQKVGYSEFKRERMVNDVFFIYLQKFPYYYYD
ncbi:MAG: GNAT family N-acetyltransferase [Deltaproteobacteria bacterium]|jgi:GNAT superfamily N-acetyltransferase|nr:GNAT family N-acetyltransferase [Deltaproteobacteria bacterium]